MRRDQQISVGLWAPTDLTGIHSAHCAAHPAAVTCRQQLPNHPLKICTSCQQKDVNGNTTLQRRVIPHTPYNTYPALLLGCSQPQITTNASSFTHHHRREGSVCPLEAGCNYMTVKRAPPASDPTKRNRIKFRIPTLAPHLLGFSSCGPACV